MKSLANVVGGKTARACDSCVKRRARWYCAADDAFLCHSCDGKVHSANPLARRHERVRLKSASPGHSSSSPPHPPTWHQGFTRKSRTRRGGKKSHAMVFHDLVPEMSSEDQSFEVEEQLIFEVPVLNPMGDEQRLNEPMETKIEFPLMSICFKSSEEEDDNAESCLNGLFPTDIELAQFSADVEILLGGGADREFHAMDELGLGEMLKIDKEEVEEEEEVATVKVCDLDDADETTPFEISFEYEYSQRTTFEEKDEKEDVEKNMIDVGSVNEISGSIKEENNEKIHMLRLDYESVISTWGGQGTPWTAHEPPQIDLNMLCCPTDSMVESGGEDHHHKYFRGLGLHMGDAGSGGREARVSRYREKRRTRLFSKKIRYEVRKLNAEKRPRMKGRFVKRSSIAAAH
ncbi:Zinc finger protein CONSTANS-LIKE 6 [Raphanus sativus]|uniref:Zinc finger protein CONSTANS-LIKE 6 n=1 Tax=Raphanus sativus TaxID=3726 RepID=A0A6J0LGW0_RAPSA|nr:zinc finger protein CONSTANS-LIKE 6 [Raphanus sativus]KAJ4909744.1 Zinc finger protein CONSTANS-LIKE 6 [Raphanus sativus]